MDELEVAIQYITQEAVKNTVQTEVYVQTIASHAILRGLRPEHIDKLVHYVGNHQKGGAWLNARIVRSLIPTTNVPSSAALKAICYIGLGRIPMNTKVLLLKWVILVYHFIDNLTPLQSLYGAIINHVTVDDLRPLICQLLYYLTRQEDVKPYRAQRLLQIREQVGDDEAPLEGLLTVYQLYAPHLVPVSIKPQKKWFNTFERALAANIFKVQALRHEVTLESPSIQHKDSVTLQPPNAKRRRTEVDVLFPKQLVDLRLDKDKEKMVITPLTSFSDLLAHVDQMQLPSQMAVILQYPVMQHLFAISADKTASIRLTNWLQGVLLSEVIESRSNIVLPWIESLLQHLVSLTCLLLEPIPIVEAFLADYLKLWDGLAYQKEILQLISCSLRLQYFDDLQNDFLDPLRKLIFTSESVEYKYFVLQTFTEMLRHFVTTEWPRYQKYLQTEDHSTERFLSVFVMEYPDDLNPKSTIMKFISYTDDLMIQCLQQTHSDPIIQAAAADFHLMVARLPSGYNVPVFILPSPDFHFLSLFSVNAMAVTSACEHLLSFQKSLNLARNWPVADRVSSSTVEQYNHIVLAFCDALWRCLLFAEERQSNFKSLGFSLTNDHLIMNCKIKNPSERLHITQHTALLGYVSSFLSKVQTGERKIHPTMITHQSELRDAYLDYLTSHHMDGIVTFINTFIRRN
ncbi:centromere protein I-like isoform X2 [Dysidea avara]|uniref:centromere protein I-like isoform X2 n=1 Tax=Dysidea avara TaxID=196820 RepID=UPI00332D3A34